MDTKHKKKFKADLDEFFLQGRSGALDIWSYDDPKAWESLVKAAMTGESSYYMTPVEQTLLEDRSPEIDAEIRKNGIGVDTVFVRGTGTGEKLMPLVRSINGNLRNVFLFDLSRTFTTLAANRIMEARPEITTFEINYDFESESRMMKFNAHSLGLELGGTICNIATKPGSNFPFGAIENRLKRASTIFNGRNDGWFLITQHTNPDVGEIIRNYDDEFCHRVASNALRLAHETFDTEGFHPSMFQHKPMYSDFGDGNGVISHNIMLQDDVRTRLEESNKPLEFKIQGTSYSLPSSFCNATINSYLPSVSTFENCAARAGFRLHKSFASPNDRMTLHLLKYEPEAVNISNRAVSTRQAPLPPTAAVA